MKKNSLILLLTILLSHCNSSTYSEKESILFLKEILKNIEVLPGDNNSDVPINELLFTSKYKLSNPNNKNIEPTYIDEIADSMYFKIDSYNLENEKSESVYLDLDSSLKKFHKYAILEEDGFLYQDIGIDLTLTTYFKTLNGFITLEFILPKNIVQKTKIPINLSYHD